MTATPPSPPPRPPFQPVDTSFSNPSAADDVESPSLSSGNALARFEFEPGRSKDGTKVLMVEWEDDDTTRDIASDWEISWEGKRTVLPAKEQASGSLNRLYFLLGAGLGVPTTVRLRKGEVHWRTNPLPAIFPPELGATARAAGKKGVLHTIWAKKRLQVLQGEIEREGRENIEGLGYQMAVAEKEWIEANFGIASQPGKSSIPNPSSPHTLHSPASPQSPGGGRLMEKLKGLRLGTTTEALSPSAAPTQTETPFESHNPLSPETSDVAVGSFSSFTALKGMPDASSLASKPAQRVPLTSAPQEPIPQLSQPATRRLQPQHPPSSIAAQQHQAPGGGMGSLNALASSNDTFESIGFSRPTPAFGGAAEQDEDDLFALPMSPRSPEMAKSPFSFGKADTEKYLQGGAIAHGT